MSDFLYSGIDVLSVFVGVGAEGDGLLGAAVETAEAEETVVDSPVGTSVGEADGVDGALLGTETTAVAIVGDGKLAGVLAFVEWVDEGGRDSAQPFKTVEIARCAVLDQLDDAVYFNLGLVEDALVLGGVADVEHGCPGVHHLDGETGVESVAEMFLQHARCVAGGASTGKDVVAVVLS